MKESLETRFWSRVERADPDECWAWTGTRTKGYGQIWHEGRFMYAHRFAYETLVGAIPNGLELDHLCRKPGCVNPKHLEPVTHQENVLRGHSVSARNARKTHCPRGHPLSGDNLYVRPNAPGRVCRTCNVDLAREWRERQKDAYFDHLQKHGELPGQEALPL